MKNFISILLLSSFLLSATELNQLLKTPLLIQHFIKHEKENPKLSFIGFLEMHYFNGDPRDADYDQDMRLPFKSHDNCATVTFLNVPTIINQQDFKIILYPQVIKINPPRDKNYSSYHLKAIWQPPKFS
ncbi:MAG: hypothetical protein KKE39_13540 [Bacteroidetes bacterium]|nr:hypothetical protein [Bacteroidota bacterium]MBU1371164.1 hypothetical protein [Bacteroidota bacterium]MBU1486178.1 hypothetical protein [Bacteroidota bacterium]MBU1762092.1 hypothetical protein [Bacteroidota bacterium]MBU2376563.1 hypothetical protein [Bacteroidota bacterium]